MQTYRNRIALCLALLALTPACRLKLPSEELKVPSKGDVKHLLAEIFPTLTDDELDEYAAKLDIDAVLKLEVELDGIRRIADKLSKELEGLAGESAQKRKSDLGAHNDGFPGGLEPLGRAAFYDQEQHAGRIDLCGIWNDHSAISLDAEASVEVRVDGKPVEITLECVPQTPVDIVFLVDITGSMSPVIGAVRRSLAAFVQAIEQRKIRGTLGVVTFQDTVGVDIDFQERAPKNQVERSPFFEPVAIDDAAGLDELERFIARLQANSGADRPENLAAALDFARNNVIGLTSKGAPNRIGDGVEDPAQVSAWPEFQNAKQIFIVVTDAPFHSDSRTPGNSSLLAPFKPRPIADILRSLQRSGTTVHVSDPSWVDETEAPSGAASEVSVDADLWARNTGGLGEDRTVGYSLVDLDLLVVAKDTGLLDILLDGVIGSTCSAHFDLPSLSADAHFELELKAQGQVFSDSLSVSTL